MWTERQAVEIFHLTFLCNFGTRVDKALFALKGGCNLRFFHRSTRYSEDMDLDLRTMAPGTLRSNVEAVLSSDAFRHGLRAQGLEVSSASAPKQTQTNQRWKITLQDLGSGTAIPTKIEFSRRALEDGAELAPVESELIRRYKLYPVIVQRYSALAALKQKISALALRPGTQARDLFDLALLIDAGAANVDIGNRARELLPKAIDNAMSIGFEEFKGQVVAFLEPGHQDEYRGRADWEKLHDTVIAALEELAR
jgi:predicted nucleotidyltransferase component of viral defense system